MKIGPTIQDLRKKKWVSRLQLATHLGISTEELQLIEEDQAPVTKEIVHSVAEFLDVPAVFILTKALPAEETANPELASRLKPILDQLIDLIVKSDNPAKN